MAILLKLAELGFTNAVVIREGKGTTTVRVRTAEGWIYHKFGSVDLAQPSFTEVESWAKFHKPEVQA